MEILGAESQPIRQRIFETLDRPDIVHSEKSSGQDSEEGRKEESGQEAAGGHGEEGRTAQTLSRPFERFRCGCGRNRLVLEQDGESTHNSSLLTGGNRTRPTFEKAKSPHSISGY